MLKKCIYIITMLIFGNALFAQHTVSGIVTDDQKESLIGATVVLLNAVDSTMVGYGITNDRGAFKLQEVNSGSYVLQITYVGYDHLLHDIHVKGKKMIDVGSIILHKSTEVIQEITVSAERIPLSIRGDTVVYNASAFKTQANASVEDLLKKMPGIQIAKDGKIKAHGKKVENVLVDGKEFFGSDHRIATKNLEANMIEKVEVYDMSSEIAAFTGVSDGEEEKTINLRLKEEHKNGGFGNIELTGGSQKRYMGHGRYFRFSPKNQTAVILSSNNINEENFSVNDQIAYQGGLKSMLKNGEKTISLNRDPRQDGVNTSTIGGVNWSYDFSPRFSFSSDYMLRRNIGLLDATTSTQNFSDSRKYATTQKTKQDNRYLDHTINTNLQFKPHDSFAFSSENNMSWSGMRNSLAQKTNFYSKDTSIGNTMADQRMRQYGVSVDSENTLKYKIGKQSLITKASINYHNANKRDSVYNYNYFAPINNTLHQQQLERFQQRGINLENRYTHRFTKKWHGNIVYSYHHIGERPSRRFYNITDSTRILDSGLTRLFQHRKGTHQLSLGVGRNTKKWRWNIHTDYRYITMNGKDSTDTNLYAKKGSYILPSFDLEYKISSSQALSLRYTSDVILPEVRQLSPIVDNTNPNILYIGNPDLSPQYNQRIQLDHHMYDSFSSVLFFANIVWEHTKNKVVNAIHQDTSLFTTIRPINSKDYNTFQLFANYSTPIRKLGIDLQLSSNSNFTFYESSINNKLSDVSEQGYGIDLSIRNRKQRHYSIEVGTRIMHNIRRFEQYKEHNQQYTNIDYFAAGAIFLPRKWTINIDANYSTFSNASFAKPTHFFVTNLGVEHVFGKGRFSGSFKINDVFNKNRGYSRSTSAFSLEERNFNTIGRTFLLGIKYKIGKESTMF